jgi:hypothetical protein
VAVEKALAYGRTVLITDVKSFIAQASGIFGFG